MARKYYTVLTDIGAALIANAPIQGKKVIIKEFAVGDGFGGYYKPTPRQTALKNEVYRGSINEYIAEKNTIKIRGIIPAEVGGFTVREIGVFNENGYLIAIANVADTIKTTPEDGVTYQMKVGFTISINGNVDCIKVILEDINTNNMKELIEAAKAEIYAKTLYPGKLEVYPGNGELPPGFLLCNGAEISRETYADLFAVIGTTYGSGDGLNTFNLPDLTARFVMGDTIAGQVKEAGLPEISGRTLLYQYTGWPENTFGAFTAATTGGGTATNTSEVLNIKDVYFNFNASRSNPIYGKSDTVQPPALTMKYIIKY